MFFGFLRMEEARACDSRRAGIQIVRARSRKRSLLRRSRAFRRRYSSVELRKTRQWLLGLGGPIAYGTQRGTDRLLRLASRRGGQSCRSRLGCEGAHSRRSRFGADHHATSAFSRSDTNGERRRISAGSVEARGSAALERSSQGRLGSEQASADGDETKSRPVCAGAAGAEAT